MSHSIAIKDISAAPIIDQAEGWYAAIKANVDRYYADAITHEQFHENNVQLHDFARANPSVAAALRELMLNELRAGR